jgi:hypothetical protein
MRYCAFNFLHIGSGMEVKKPDLVHISEVLIESAVVEVLSFHT